MAHPMIHVLACIFLLMPIVTKGQIPTSKPPKIKPPKTVKCNDKKFGGCFNIPKTCPDTCPQDCKVNCWTCEALCLPLQPPSAPPPPPSPPRPKPVKNKSPPPPPPLRSPPPPTYTHPPPPPSSYPPPPTYTHPPPPLPQSSSSPPPPPPLTSNLSPPPPDSSVVSGKQVYCKVKKYTQCYRQEFRCPSACPDQCEVDCVTCSPVCECNRPGAICQDPRFTGADGITFYFHGKKGHDFCMVSDKNVHINGHFIGRRNHKMKRDFTWVQALGILFDNNQLYIGAKKTSTWIDTIERLDIVFNGEPIYLTEREGFQWKPSSSATASGVAITRTRDTNAVVITVENNFQIKVNVVPITEKDSYIHKYGITADEDCFAHLDLSFKFYSLSDEVNGLLGQTYAINYVSRAKMGVDMAVLGGDKEFSSSGIFKTDCGVSRFSGIPPPNFNASTNLPQYATDLKCSSSGLGGHHGVVCK